MENYTKRDGDSALSDNCRQPPFKKPMNNNPAGNHLLACCAGSAISALLAFSSPAAEAGIHLHGEIRVPAAGQAVFLYDPSRIPHLGIFPMRTAHLRLYPCRRTHLRHQGHLPRLPCSCMEPQAALPRPFLAGGRLPRTSCRTPYAMPAPSRPHRPRRPHEGPPPRFHRR